MLNNNIFIKKISTVINIKGINNKKYNVSEYIRLKLFFYELADIALIEREFHIVDDLTITVLIDIDIIKLKRITLDFGNNTAIFGYYNNTSISIEVHSYCQDRHRCDINIDVDDKITSWRSSMYIEREHIYTLRLDCSPR